MEQEEPTPSTGTGIFFAHFAKHFPVSFESGTRPSRSMIYKCRSVTWCLAFVPLLAVISQRVH